MRYQTAEHTSHCMLVTDFKSMLKYSDWSSYIFVVTELSNLEIKGRSAVKPSYRCLWFLDDRAGTMAIDIGGERLALEKRPNRDGIAVWRLVE